MKNKAFLWSIWKSFTTNMKAGSNTGHYGNSHSSLFPVWVSAGVLSWRHKSNGRFQGGKQGSLNSAALNRLNSVLLYFLKNKGCAATPAFTSRRKQEYLSFYRLTSCVSVLCVRLWAICKAAVLIITQEENQGMFSKDCISSAVLSTVPD